MRSAAVTLLSAGIWKSVLLALLMVGLVLASRVSGVFASWPVLTSNGPSAVAAMTLAAPTGLTVSGRLRSRRLTLAWTAPPAANAGTATQVWESPPGGGGNFTQVATVTPGTATTYQTPPLRPFTRYCFYLVTANGAWTSAPSTSACGRTG